MTCYTRCGNLCCPNSPRPIFVFGDCSMSNDVVNPIIPTSVGFFENILGSTVTSGGIIPLTLTSSRGSKIYSGTQIGTIVLTPGVYEINYSINAQIPTSGNASIILSENGAQSASSIVTASGTVGSEVSMSKTIIVDIENQTTMQILNNGTGNLQILNGNMIIKEI